MRQIRRMRQLAAAVAILVTALVSVTAAQAHFDSSPTAPHSVATLTVGNPSGATAATADGCATVTVSWTAAPDADSYRVQYSENAGAWIDLQVETGNVTQLVDATGHPGRTVTYRIHGRDASSDWEGTAPASSSSLTCP